ncbi:NERD domain-containing protein [Nocardia sp. NBC_00508]|uniref:nuclease-related domain-containing protein n=1 Tax=Nocardia sp. NBC_00508 TaxID=2975992 RepID=UPI002E81BDC8|nr:nuclease-related domain-containing protein [Nocardia sp. NBC_00508]WUD66971.1 NERD domain-containing protein [Nocardia sp. NBC_00508]
MLVRVQNAAGTNAERALIDWLRTWKDPESPHGVATINCSLFHKDRLHQFDAVIWTPTSCVVIEADGLVARQDGALEVPLNGPWTINGEPAATESRDRRTPLEKSREHTFALQEWLAARGLGQRVVHGVALVVPLPGAQLRLEQAWADPSFDVIIGDDPVRLRHYFDALAAEEKFLWTANDVAIAFRGLGILPYLPAPQDLLAEGFLGPIDITLWHGGPNQAQAEAYAEELAQLERDARASTVIQAPWYSPWKLYPREPGDLDLGRAVMRTVLAIGMVIAFVWVLWFVVTAILTYGPG